MKYDNEFKRQVVRKVLDGQSVRSVSREIGVSESQIHKWRRAVLKNGDGQHSGAELAETLELKKRIRELEMENEILKKAALIFGLCLERISPTPATARFSPIDVG